MLRLATITALALQLLGCTAPANAFILCISDDGCVELELAAPGTARCVEEACDDEHADQGHGCADIPVLHDAVGPRRAAVNAPAAVAVLIAAPGIFRSLPILTAPAALLPLPAAAVAPRRTVVLQV
jgi:hypothetical protein